MWEGTGFAQEDYRIRRSLTLNIGLRYERLGQFGDRLGRNASFDIGRAQPNPAPSGRRGGLCCGLQLSRSTSAGVLRANNAFGNYGAGQSTIAPRIGFAWQFLPRTNRMVLRGGYGTYYSRPTGQAFYQNILGAPFSVFRFGSAGAANANATFQAPFPQPFPTQESALSLRSPRILLLARLFSPVAPGFRPDIIQQYSLNVQLRTTRRLVVGNWIRGHSRHALGPPTFSNQALSASANGPIRGVTINSVANIPLRVPFSVCHRTLLWRWNPRAVVW